MRGRPKICYVAPGHALLGASGTTRNMLSLAAALSQWADVTLAFRAIREPFTSDKFQVVAIEPETEIGSEHKDDVAARGLNVSTHAGYLRKLAAFSKQLANSYDLIFEKGWRLSGFLSSTCQRNGVPAVLVENDIRHWSDSLASIGAIARYGMHGVAQRLARFWSSQVGLIIAETEELKSLLISKRRIAADRIEVVELGVDHALFRPLSQSSCRNLLGIEPSAFVLLYVGGMDTYHDLEPLLETLAQISVPSLELHIVGDGVYRPRCEGKAKHAKIPVRFHGYVSDRRVPEFIGAADLCLAPYRVHAFPNNSVFFSTLKIPEYMACARPVVSVPSGHIKRLIENEISGFLFSNDVVSWLTFLRMLPSRERLTHMGRAAAQAVAPMTWQRTAKFYLSACEKLTTQQLLPQNMSMVAESNFTEVAPARRPLS